MTAAPLLFNATGSVLPDVHRIAVLRANLLGDFAVSLPAFDALRHAYPEAEISLLGRQWHRDFLRNRPGPIDRVIVIPDVRGLREGEPPSRDLTGFESFFERMQSEGFDLAVQMHGGGGSSNPFVRRLGARITAGLHTPDAEPLDICLEYDQSQHETIRCLELVARLGAIPVTLEPRLEVTDEDLEESRARVPETGSPLVALHPGARHPERRWPADRFAAIGDALASRGVHVVVTGTETERHVVEECVEAMVSSAQNLCGVLSLRGLAGLLSRCAVVISNDTGPLHLAEAVGSRTVGIYCGFNLVNFGPLARTRHRPVVSWQVDRPSCGQNCLGVMCEECPPFVAGITVEEVLERVQSFGVFCRLRSCTG